MTSQTSQGDHLRRMIDEALLAGHSDCVSNLFNDVVSRAKDVGVEFDGKIVLEYFWGLARIGVVAVPGDLLQVLTGRTPRMVLTHRGRQLLERGQLSPHNTSKYLSAVEARVAQPDEVALTYLSEAAEAWKTGLNRSSAVMLGCACERLVLALGEAIGQSNHVPWAQKIGSKLAKKVFISELFEDIRGCLIELKGQKLLPRELGDALDRKLAAIFDHARGLRNVTGHPTGEDITSEDAEAGLLLFPGFYELVDRLIQQVHIAPASTPAAQDGTK